MLIGLNGVKERVKIDEHLLVQVVSSIGEYINEVDITILNQLWQNIRELRINSNWLDGFKVPPEKIPQFIKEIKKVNIPTEHWGNPLQGNVNIILLQGQETKDTYLKLKEITEKLGGATSWYYDSKYGLLDPRINGMLQHIQRKFDPQGVFGPTGGE